jgi:hypothetical protein
MSLERFRAHFAAFALVGVLTLSGCSSDLPSGQAALEESISSEIPNSPRARLIYEVDELPETSVKRVLISRALPYYQNQTPFTIDRSSLKVNVYSANISYDVGLDQKESGIFIMHGKNMPSANMWVRSPESVIRKIPLPNILMASDVDSVPKNNIGPDGKTFLMNFQINKGDYVPAGVYPEISVTSPDPKIIKDSEKDFYASMERFAYIKELSSLLFVDLTMEEIYKAARRDNLSTTVNVKDVSGNMREVEIITDFWNTLFNFTPGRMMAVVDIAGYLMAMKAFQGTEMIGELSRDANINPALSLISKTDLGDTPHEIWLNTFNLIMSHPELQSLPHKGDMNKLP